jgi:alpha-tubulin suppressor-like RCC1 family protein
VHITLVRFSPLGAWGLNHDGQLGAATSPSGSPTVVSGLSNVIAVAAGGYHTCAIISDGRVRCWGNNDHGQLGNGTNNGSATPVLVPGISGTVALTAGAYHTCAIDRGTISCWGLNANGQLGDGTTQDRNTPVPLSWAFNTGYQVTHNIAAGGFHTCVILQDSTVTCWGMNNDGQLGRPYPGGLDPWEPTAGIRVQIKDPGCAGCAPAMTFLPNATAIAASLGVGQIGGTPLGGFHTVALDSGGLDSGWGYNGDGELNGVISGSQQQAVRGIISSSGTPLTPAKIAAGAYHTCMSSAQAGVFCRGHNGNGESGPSPNTATPADAVPTTVGAVDLAAGGVPLVRGCRCAKPIQPHRFCYVLGVQRKWTSNRHSIGRRPQSVRCPSVR